MRETRTEMIRKIFAASFMYCILSALTVNAQSIPISPLQLAQAPQYQHFPTVAFCNERDTIDYKNRRPDGVYDGEKILGDCLPTATTASVCDGNDFVIVAGGQPNTRRVVTFGLKSDLPHFQGEYRVTIHAEGTYVHHSLMSSGVPGKPLRREDIQILACRIYEYEKQCGGYDDPCEKKENTKEASSKPSESDLPTAARPGSQAEDLFGAALSKTPEQLRQESAAISAQASSVGSVSSGATSGGADPGMKVFGALLGGYVAGRTGNTALLQALTGQDMGGVPSLESGGIPNAGIGTAPNAVTGGNCDQIQQQLGNGMTNIQNQLRGQSLHCVVNPRQADLLAANRAQIAQACPPQFVQYVDNMIASYRQNQSTVCSSSTSTPTYGQTPGGLRVPRIPPSSNSNRSNNCPCGSCSSGCR